ncbi:MAG: ACT domain-containing protein [Treponemataceae bacterium]|uniref:ACT domain-containing protein n=1 Tax=Treponema sp. J25 TaxID=2094121 RepID=UPI001049A599|nr:ACT domain-containing protein [Treponema sp. J25]MCX7949036.1 ACT domain-containing protein [Treponemataceae bacterium]HOJ99678.1 ACT domain-containing protein [Termitinemataceae bacterium]TCW60864.1 amino acid-binding protein [Treponema sp. J25]HOM23809.1 ACT domain-containing protein [Termitinemataceae bacterium]HPQ00886.1 ACT domain-containing protein [Termitinemataceae bacterium]
MKIKQISVFLENTAGRLAEVTRVLAQANINIRAISIADTADFGILRLIVDKSEEAAQLLSKAGFTARLTDVLAVEIPDVPGSLARVMEIFRENKVNIEYLYASLEGETGKAVVIFKVEDIEHGLAIVQQHGLAVVEKF